MKNFLSKFTSQQQYIIQNDDCLDLVENETKEIFDILQKSNCSEARISLKDLNQNTEFFFIPRSKSTVQAKFTSVLYYPGMEFLLSKSLNEKIRTSFSVINNKYPNFSKITITPTIPIEINYISESELYNSNFFPYNPLKYLTPKSFATLFTQRGINIYYNPRNLKDPNTSFTYFHKTGWKFNSTYIYYSYIQSHSSLILLNNKFDLKFIFPSISIDYVSPILKASLCGKTQFLDLSIIFHLNKHSSRFPFRISKLNFSFLGKIPSIGNISVSLNALNFPNLSYCFRSNPFIYKNIEFQGTSYAEKRNYAYTFKNILSFKYLNDEIKYGFQYHSKNVHTNYFNYIIGYRKIFNSSSLSFYYSQKGFFVNFDYDSY